MITISTIFLLLFYHHTALAASCCGSNVSAPALITTFESWKLSLGQNSSSRELYVRADGVVVRPEAIKSQETQTLRLGHLPKDSDWQYFASFKQTENRAGDSELGIGFHLPQDRTFDVYTWLALGLPTGTSVYEISEPEDEITGSGLVTPQFGGLWTKSFLDGDISAAASVGQGLSRKIGDYEIVSRPQGQLSLGGGFFKKQYRLGLDLSHQWNQGRTVSQGGTVSKVPLAQSWPLSLSFTYMQGMTLFTLSYMDETLIGPAYNSDLNQSLNVNLVHRWY